MIFSSMLFLWIFLPIALIGNYIAYKLGKIKWSNLFLLVISIMFYAWGEPIYVLLMLCSIFVNWYLGILIDKAIARKKIILILSIIFNITLLGYFKYVGMLVDIINTILGSELKNPNVALPIGISFFTFQALSYIVDVYRGQCKAQNSILKLALYISFFPQLIAGPIVKYIDINEQIDNRELGVTKVAEGIRRFVYGLGKKVLIANVLALCTDTMYSIEISQLTGSMVWLASILYTFQIYYDFSGYSDMAIGLGKMLGFEFKENFNYPYTALSIREFWRRWHISLGSWFKEYVYIPLGGSRKGNRLTCENLFVIFLLTGIWHGAGYNFIVWGLFHGFFNIVERLGYEKLLKNNKVLSWIYTFLVVNIGWIFFRIENIREALAYIKRILLPWRYSASIYSMWEYIDFYTIFTLLCAILGMGIIQRIIEKKDLANKWKYSIADILSCMFILVFSIFSLASNTYNPFIYFRF